MRWRLRGKEVWVNDAKRRMDWERKAPSKGAQAVKDFFRKHLPHDVWFEEYVLPGGAKLRVDFLNATRRFAVEFNGRQHDDYVPFFHKDVLGRSAAFRRDVAKIEFLEDNKFKVVEIKESDLPLTRQFFLDHEIPV